jgi:hypothetical protein
MKASWLTALLVLIACEGSGAGGRHESIGPRGEPLKTAFNEAAGKIRAVLLGAPT